MAPTTSFVKHNSNSFSIYPNPTANGFSVSAIIGIARVTLLSSYGIALFEQEISSNNYMSFNTLSSGVYIVRVSEASGISDYTD